MMTFAPNTTNERITLDQTYHVYLPKVRNSTFRPHPYR